MFWWFLKDTTFFWPSKTFAVKQNSRHGTQVGYHFFEALNILVWRLEIYLSQKVYVDMMASFELDNWSSSNLWSSTEQRMLIFIRNVSLLIILYYSDICIFETSLQYFNYNNDVAKLVKYWKLTPSPLPLLFFYTNWQSQMENFLQ